MHWKSISSAPEDGSWFLVRGGLIQVPAHARMVGTKVCVHTIKEVHGEIPEDHNNSILWHPLPPGWNTPS